MIIVRTDTDTPPDDGGGGYVPPQPAREPRLNLAVLLTGVDGSTWDMYGGPVKLTTGVRFGIANPTHWTREAPAVDGATWQGFRTPPVDPFWPVHLRDIPTSIDWRDTYSAFAKAVDPSGVVTMTVITPDGQARTMKARYVSGLDAEYEHDPLMMRYATYGLEFLAVDPFWHVPHDPVRYEALDTVPFFPGPPWHLSPVHTIGSATVDNPGDVASWPMWTITGPFTGFTVGVGDASVTYAGSKADEGYVVIDMNPATRSITDETGDRDAVWLNLVDVNFAAIPPGDDIALSLDLQGEGDGTSIQLDFDELYRSFHVTDLPVVKVWQQYGTGWALVDALETYDDLTVQPKHLEAGPWSMTIPYNDQALRILRDRLLTVDWRGQRIMTCGIDTFNPHSDETTGQPVLTVAGVDVLDRLGWVLLWPNPAAAIDSQPANGSYPGPTETVLLNLIRDNHVTRYGANPLNSWAANMVVPVSSGRGVTITAKPRFNNALVRLVARARVAGLGLSLGLVDTSGSRAKLTVSVYQPLDRSKRVQLSQAIGNLTSWSQSDTAPKTTSAVVGGAGDGASRIFSVVTTTDSIAAATTWGGHREGLVDGPDSFDSTDLTAAGQGQLATDAATVNMAVVAAEASGLLAFTDYNVGDLATGVLFDGETLVDVISAIEVKVDENGVGVTPAFGDPDAGAAAVSLAKLQRDLRRRIEDLEGSR